MVVWRIDVSERNDLSNYGTIMHWRTAWHTFVVFDERRKRCTALIKCSAFCISSIWVTKLLLSASLVKGRGYENQTYGDAYFFAKVQGDKEYREKARFGAPTVRCPIFLESFNHQLKRSRIIAQYLSFRFSSVLWSVQRKWFFCPAIVFR